jgi:hypothetical protein
MTSAICCPPDKSLPTPNKGEDPFKEFGRADRFTGSSSVKKKLNRVIANEDSGQNIARFQRSTDVAEIRRLPGQATLSDASAASSKNKLKT